LPKKIRASIIEAVEKLPEPDGWRNVKPLKNHIYDYRLRVGQY